MSEETVVGKRFTIVIPKVLRQQLGLKEGQRVLLQVEKRKLLLEPLPAEPYAVLARVVGEPYHEARDEPRAEAWLKKHAGR
jgi:AbrB family looped-hinge helix DNA binding protein